MLILSVQIMPALSVQKNANFVGAKNAIFVQES
jgi:hypothetical protein